MICPYCKSENIEGADECVNCGEALYGLDLPDAGTKSTSPPFIHETLDALPQRPVVTVEAGAPLGLALRLMQTNDTGAVLVTEAGRLTGIITSWDVLHKVAGRNDDLNAVTCGSIMTPDPVVFHYDDTMALALNKMAIGDFRHVPIVRNDQPVSIIDVNDLFRHLSPRLL